MAQQLTDKAAESLPAPERGNKLTLTDKAAKSLPAPESGNKLYYDDMVGGFALRVTTAGFRAFIVNYRRRGDGLERRYTIGAFPDWSVAAAREKAKELKRHIDNGGDPVGEHTAERGAPTVATLAERFLAEHVAKLRPSTQRDFRSALQNDVLPVLGRLKVVAVDFEHIERLHTKITQRAPIRANRVLATCSKMFALAIRWKMRETNPCRGIQRNKESGRRRYLRPEELARLTKALATEPNQQAADAIRLLLLTGARRGEVLATRWQDFDLPAKLWVKPATSTKQAREHRVPLNAPALEILTRLHDGSSEFVFPSRRGGPRVELKSVWARVCKAAGIADLRLHDLRHSHASFLVSAGFSLPTIGALLGHSQPATTARYSHLLDDPLRQASERVGAIIAGKGKAEVVPLARGKRT